MIIERDLIALQARLMYVMNIKKWTKCDRSICTELDLIRKKIPFFFMTAGRLAVGGFVNTIDGEYEICIIGIKNIMKRIALHHNLPKGIYLRNRRVRNNNIIIILYQGTRLPLDVIKEILYFSQ